MNQDQDPFDASGPTASIREALAALDPEERDAILATFYGAVSYQQLAFDLGVSEETIKARIRRGLTHMHRSLGESAPNGGDAQPRQQPTTPEPRSGLCDNPR